MTSSPLSELDIPYLRALHEQFYKEEFNFPNFAKSFLTTFKIVNDKGAVITAGGVKLNPELILITDKDALQNDRVFALVSAMQLGTWSARSAGYEMLYASVINDPIWEKQLRNVGFKDSIGKSLVIG
jgi:hypothetical protein